MAKKRERNTVVELIPDEEQVYSEDGVTVYDNDDGNTVVDFHPRKQNPKQNHHQENLAETLSEHVLNSLASRLIEAIEDDIDSRSDWEDRLAKSIDLLGLKFENRDYPFKGATGVYSSIMLQSLVATNSVLCNELIPAGGPVKIRVLGEETEEIQAKAMRVEAYNNFFYTTVATEFYPDFEQMVNWAILHGSAFKKSYFDPSLGRPTSRYIKPQDVIVNYGTTDLDECSRIAERLFLNDKEFKTRIRTGMYRDLKIKPIDDLSNSIVRDRLQVIDGIEPSDFEYNKSYELYEAHVDIIIDDLEEDNQLPLPYIITVDINEHKILAIYRNWEESDKLFKKKLFYTHYQYIPSLGFYGWGLGHLVGGNATAATAITRQLIDAGMLCNFPGGLRAAGTKFESNNEIVAPTEWIEVHTGGLPIDQAFMPMPYKEPSAVLKQLKDDTEQAIKDVISAGETALADINPNAPVGTILALFEQKNRLQSSILKRFHRSLARELKIMFKLLGQYLPDQKYPFTLPGEAHIVLSNDFSDDLNITPVSDPNLNSNTQSLLIAETLNKFATENPDIYNKKEIQKRLLTALKVPEMDKLFVQEEEVVPRDPITENQNAIQNKALKAAIWQDHPAHIFSHADMIQGLSKDPANNSQSIENLKAHIKTHEAMQYQLDMQTAMHHKMPDDPSKLSPSQQNALATKAADAAAKKAQSAQEQEQQQPIEVQVMMEDLNIKRQEVERKAQESAAKIQIEQQKLQLEQMKLQMQIEQMQMKVQADMQTTQSKIESDIQRDQLKAQGEMQRDQFKAQTELQKEQMKSDTDLAKVQLQEEIKQEQLAEKGILPLSEPTLI